MKWFFLPVLFFYTTFLPAQRLTREKADVLVVGGGVGGIAAAIQSARMGVKTILVEPTKMLGGMLTAAGISCTDGNDLLPAGMWEEFRQALYRHYGTSKLNTGWVSNTSFEPHVGDSIFKSWAAKEKNLTILYTYDPVRVTVEHNKARSVYFINQRKNFGLEVSADVIVDATELGDVFAAAGATYDLGMDDPATSGEKQAREKNTIIQDITWAAILKDYGAGADKTILEPPGYDPLQYHCCCTDAPCSGQPWNGDKKKMLNYGKLPRSPGATQDKYMLNWPAHGNDSYINVVEQNIASRNKQYEQAKNHTLGFIYFIQTALGMKNIGLAVDELDDGLAWIPYNREGRRVKGIVRMNIHHARDAYQYNLYRTGIAVGDYPMDHHHAQYPGKVPELEFPSIPSYTIPLGALIPEKIDGLIVCEKGISVSNLLNGTTRLQPVVLLTGQAAGVLAARTVKENKKTRDVNVRAVQSALLKAKCYLLPFVDVKPSDPQWEMVQRIGVTGILKGTGKPEGWANKMFFYPDSTITDAELAKGLFEFEDQFPVTQYTANSNLSIAKAWDMITTMQHHLRVRLGIPHKYPSVVAQEWRQTFRQHFGEKTPDGGRLVTRRELAVMLCNLSQNAFEQPINMHGIIFYKNR